MMMIFIGSLRAVKFCLQTRSKELLDLEDRSPVRCKGERYEAAAQRRDLLATALSSV